MLRLRHARPILLKRYQHLSCTISSLNLKQESTTFQDMTMVGKYLYVRTYQYSLILDYLYQKMLWGKDICQKFRKTHNYMLFNCDELRPFIQ